MSCSICQSITFQATAGSRLDGSVRYESVSVPPCLGASADVVGLPPALPPVVPPLHAARPSESARSAASTPAAAVAILPVVRRPFIAASLDSPSVPDEWSSSALLWVEGVAQPVTDEVEREHRDHDGEAGIDDEVRRREVVRLT